MNRKCKQEIRKAGWMLGSALAIVFSAASLVRGQEGRVSPLGPIEDLALSAEEGAEGVAAEEGAAEAQTAAIDAAIAQDANARISRSLWTKLDALPEALAADEGVVRPKKFQALSLDIHAMRDLLKTAPLESQIGDAKHSSFIISLPMPDGGFARFRIVDSPLLPAELAAKYPEIRTFGGEGIDDPAATIRLDSSQMGFHAQILSPKGSMYIDPHARGENAALYASYFKRDLASPSSFHCDVQVNGARPVGQDGVGVGLRSTGATRRTYRIAVATTFGYTQYHSALLGHAPNRADGLAAVIIAINRVTGIYERELGIRFVFARNSDLIVSFLSPDFFPGGPTLEQTQMVIDNLVGSQEYDIGHSFSSNGGGVASLGVVCAAGAKAQGTTGSSPPTGDAFWVDYVAHEMGHQFGANHTFNGTRGECGGNRDDAHAFEPGSGSTIMAYAGICGGDDLQARSDPHFHFASIKEISDFVETGGGSSCSVNTATGNNPPSIQAGPNKYVPSGTPLVLRAAGNDPDGDPISFCWEENDLGPAQPVSGPGSEDNGLSPLCRSWPPSQSSVRFLPMLTDLLANRTSAGERLPSVTRYPMRWRVTARDNRGGTSFADTALVVVGVPSPFRVLSPNTNVVLAGSQTVTWDTAGTQNWGQFATSAVNILLSIDGGRSFPYLLKQNTPNDGSEAVSMPVVLSDRVRIKVEAIDNVFFDVSNANCRIASPPATVSATKGTLCGKIRIKWSTVPGATSYRIHRSETSVFNPTVLISKAANATSHDDAPPETGRTYYYWVKPINANSLSAVSSIVNGWAAAPITAAPQRVTLTRDISTGNLVLAWAKVSGAASYEVFRSESPTPCSGTPLGTTSKLTFSNRPPLPLIRYYYSVRAKNGCGAGPCSQIVSGIR